jgi:hypothetical protein
MRGHERLHGLRPEEASAPHRRPGKKVLHPGPQRTAEPLPEGHVETVLASPRDLRQVGEGPPQETLAASPPHLVTTGEAEGGFHEGAVEERDASLEAARHRHTVDLGQHLVDEGRAEIGA